MIAKKLLEPFQYLFDQQIINGITKHGILRKYVKQDIIIDIGQDLQYVPLLIEGNIKVLREDDNGDELLLYILESGDTCAMSLTCCMAKSKSKIRAVADNDVKIIMIPTLKMKAWFNDNESWRNFILESYQIRFNEMLETIDTIAFMNMDQRLLKYLSDKAKFSSSNTIKITHLQIAEDLHTSRVVISRLLKKFENEGKIELGRNKIKLNAL